MYISRVVLSNIRAFRRLDLRLGGGPAAKRSRQKPGRRTIVLGPNGTGKSTLLRCIAIGLCTQRDAGALLANSPGRLLAEGQREAQLAIEVVPDRRDALRPGDESMVISTTIADRDGEDVIAERTDRYGIANELFVCGYGAGRTVEARSDIGREYRVLDAVATLFDYDRPLISIELTLRRLRDFLGDEPYAGTIRGLRRALGLGPRDKIELPKGGGVVVSGPRIGQEVPLEGWADGYRLTLSWVLDLYAWAIRAERVTPSGGIRGIGLVDELEQHLHPSLQIDLLGRLGRLLPDLQIIGTTHSPLIALGASPNDLVVLKRKGGRVVAEEHVPDFTRYSAEDMLVDPHTFDAPAYEPETTRKLARYRKLAGLRERQRTARQREELKSLASELASQQVPEARQSEAAKELRRLIEKHEL